MVDIHARADAAGATAAPGFGRRLRSNLATAPLVEAAIRSGEGVLAADGPLVVRTGKHNDGEVDVTLDAAEAARALVFGACKLVLAR